MSDSDFIAEPWHFQIPTAIVPKPLPDATREGLPASGLVAHRTANPGGPPAALDAITKAIDDRTDSLIIERLARKKGITLTPQPKNPKMRGLIDSMAKFNHDVDCDIENASKLIAGAHTRRNEVFTKVKDHVASTVADLGDMLANFDDLESAIGDNGAPSSDGGSQGSQEASANSTDGKVVP